MAEKLVRQADAKSLELKDSTRAPHKAARASALRKDWLIPPGLEKSHPVDLLCTQFAVRLVVAMGPKFNLRSNLSDVMNVAGNHLVWPAEIARDLQRFMARRCADSKLWQGSGGLKIEDFLKRFGTWNGVCDETTFFYYLDEYLKQNNKEVLAMMNATLDTVGMLLKGRRITLIDNLGTLSRALALDPAERGVLLYSSLCKYKRDLRSVTVDCKSQTSREAYRLFGELVGGTEQQVAMALKQGGRMESLGLIDTPLSENSITDLGDLMRGSDKLLPVLLAEYRDEAEMMATFTKPADAPKLTLADVAHVEEHANNLIALLKAATARREEGVNVLLYGAPGTGKTEFAKLIAKEAACELYEVDCVDKEGSSLSGRDRYRSLQVSQAFLRGRSQTALLFDEVEDVFPPVSFDDGAAFGMRERPNHSGSVSGKAWVNHTLEKNPVPTIWITNAIKQIDPAYLRRFQFHLEFKNPPKDVRGGIIRKALEGLSVSEAFFESLTARKTLTPAQVQSAARFCRLTLGEAEVEGAAEKLILTQLDHADKAMGVVAAEPNARPIVTTYDLSLLNIESRYPVEKMVEALKVRQRGTLCFYGLPGSGKTALAEHIARAMERPLMIKRASDLVSKWVGETEQNMAKMFTEADAEKAVLLLDEADSFLQNRQMAVRNYEVSEVNEMLQGMERFNGVFVCTTNLMDRIDEAALRRFSFKIKFLPLKDEQRERMFVNEALDGDETKLTGEMKSRLKRLRLLAPGDFATVKRQVVLLGEAMEPVEFLAQLEQEHGIKPEIRHDRPIGFVQ